ncbi:MFS transporter [Williamsia sp. 1138]|uniref:MFS transporter n=1 Tax=Williamsia sp. 1138 TaxID=1903117 RepID=UPI000A11CA78|nr:MFS transporter [Williamsia sp. 1138]OZG26155.1 MFS transporter [Williamsia sp. 1138]
MTTIASERDIYDAYDTGTPTNRMKWVWILGLGGVFFEAYAGAALATGLDPLKRQLDLSTTQVSLITSSYMLVAVLLCPFAGAYSDRFGRIRVIILAKIIACASMILALTAPNFELLLTSRVLLGVAWAMDFGVVLAYIAEFLRRQDQPKLSRWQGVWYVATTSNLLVGLIIFQFHVGDSIWRYLMGTAAVLAAALAVLQIALLPESPRWLASRGRFTDAVVALQTVYKVDAVAGRDRPIGSQAPDGPGKDTGRASPKQLFQRPLLGRTVLSTVSFGAQALQYYAIGWFLPVIALQLFGESFQAATLGAIVFNAVGIIGGFSAAAIYQRFGIRPSVQVGFAACAGILIVFGIGFDHLPLWAAIVLPAAFILFHSALAAPGGAAFSALAYPSSLRGFGMGLSTTACNIGAFIGLFAFPYLQESFGDGGAILVTAAVPLLGFIVVSAIRWDPENELGDPERDNLTAVAH